MKNQKNNELIFEIIDTHEVDELDLSFGTCGILFCGTGQD